MIFLLTLQTVTMCRSFWSDSSWLDEVAASMVVTMLLAIPGQAWFNSREFTQLPVSRRTFWLAQWWLAVVLPAPLVVSAVYFALWSQRPQEWSWDGAALTLLYCVLYAGAFQATFTKSMALRGDQPATRSNVARLLPLMFLPVIAPAAFGPYLPHRLHEVGPITIAFLVVCVVLSVRGYRYQPAIVARLSLRLARVHPVTPPVFESAAASAAEQAKRDARLRALPLWIRALFFVLDIRPNEKKRGVADYLEGFRLLAWLEVRRDLIACISMLLFLGFVWLFGLFDKDGLPAWREFAGTLGFLPFSRASGALADTMAIGAFGFFTSMAMHGRINHLRLLRTLPLSTHRLIARVAVIGAVSAAMIWLLLLLLHLVSVRAFPLSLRFDVFLAAAAMMTLLSALRIAALGTQLPPPGSQVLSIGLACLLWYAAFRWPIASPALSLTLASLLVFALGYAILIFAVTRSSRIYRPAAVVARFQ